MKTNRYKPIDMNQIPYSAALLLSAASLIFTACGGDDSGDPTPNHDPQPIIYVAGNNGSDWENYVACYWKDGKDPFSLYDDYSEVVSASVSGSDIYLYGSTANPSLTRRSIIIWKNKELLYFHSP